MKLSSKTAEALIESLLQIPEHRMPRGIRHRKFLILAISACAIMCKAWSFAAIAEWAQRCSQNMPVAVYGKTLRGAKQAHGKQVHLISAFLQQHGIALAQTQVDCKTNEIPMVPALPDQLN